MPVALDPSVYCYDDDEWETERFLPRLESLIRMLTRLDEVELSFGKGTLVRFKTSDELFAAAFATNPNVNQPPKAFYYRQYQSQVLPALLKRNEYVTDDANVAAARAPSVIPAASQPKCILSDELIALLEICAHHGWCSDLRFVFHSDRVSIVLGSGFFRDEIDISAIDPRSLVDPKRAFPLGAGTNPAEVLSAAVRVAHALYIATDPTWAGYVPAAIHLTENFVRSLARADFRGSEDIYLERIVFALLQIATARDVTINDHSMNPQKITFGGKRHGKWNAYVFRNGPSPQDTRCSRIYYAKIEGGVLLDEYVEDAHG